MTASLKIEKKEAKRQIGRQIKQGHLLLNTQPMTQEQLESFKREYDKWHDLTNRYLTKMFTTSDESKRFNNTKTLFLSLRQQWQFHEESNHLRSNIQSGLDCLSVVLDAINENLFENEKDAPISTNKIMQNISNKVFVVHGHDDSLRHEVEAFLLKNSFTPVILHEQINQGKTIIEKFEANSDVTFAIVLLTPDDEGRKKEPDSANQLPLQSRARQNVILELGYFIAKLGRTNVCALVKGNLEIPSDFSGVVYEAYDQAGAWKHKLISEIKSAGVKTIANEMA